MSIPAVLDGRLSLPAIGAPMFLISNPALVTAQCRAGIVGSFPALNARPSSQLDEWLGELDETLAPGDAPVAVNLIAHRTNPRLEEDLALCVKHRVPIVITSLGAREDVNAAVHDYGGFVFHDVISDRFAHKAIEKGADGLVAVAAGAGGHAGAISPFALVAEIRSWFDGPLALSGSIATGAAIAAARMMGADLAYIGSAFIATAEAGADPAHKAMIAESCAADIVYSNYFSGVHGNYLKASIRRAGLDPDALPSSDPQAMDFAARTSDAPKRWRDIWGSGHGIGAVREVMPAARLVERLRGEYRAAVADFQNSMS